MPLVPVVILKIFGLFHIGDSTGMASQMTTAVV